METLFWMVALPLVLLALIVLARIGDQRDRDQQRKCYRLSFPAELTEEQVLAFVISFSGTLRSKIRVLGSPNLVFELLATEFGKQYRLWLPGGYDSLAGKELRGHISGIRMELDDSKPIKWSRVIELRQKNAIRKLRNDNSEVTSATLRHSMDDLHKGETVSMQLVVSPAVPVGKPPVFADQKAGLPRKVAALVVDRDKIAEQREKLSEANYAVGLRIAAKAKTDRRAKKLVTDVKSGLNSTRTAYTSFRQRVILPPERLAQRIEVARGPLVFQIIVTGTELVALMAWPIGEGHMPGVPRARSIQLPPSPYMPSGGRTYAYSNYGQGGQPITVTPADSCMHSWLVGPIGSGKTTMLESLIEQDMQSGAGVIVIEASGDLLQRALNRVPKERMEDVVVVDVADRAMPVGFNVLSQGRPQIVASDIQRMFDGLYPESRLRVPAALYHGLMVLMTSQAAATPMAFIDLLPLIAPNTVEDRAFSSAMIRATPDPIIRGYWHRFDDQSPAQRAQYFAPMHDRVWQFNSRPELRGIIGQGESSFDVADIIRQKKLLFVNLPGQGDPTAFLLGTFMLYAIYNAARQGAALGGHPTMVYMDEWQKFRHLPIELSDWLVEFRKANVALMLANQNLSQLPGDVLDAVFSNARTKAVFQTTHPQDSRTLADLFGRQVSADDIRGLGPYEVVMQVAVGGNVSEPVTGRTQLPEPGPGLEQLIREASRSKYGRPQTIVDKEIQERRLLVAGASQQLRSGKLPKLGLRPRGDV